VPNLSKKPYFISLIFALIFLCIELVALTLFVGGDISHLTIFGIHLLLLSVSGFLVFQAYKKDEDMTYPALLFISLLSSGSIMLCGFLLFCLLKPLFSKFSRKPADWFKELFPDSETTPVKATYDRIVSGWDDYGRFKEAVSFDDIYQLGSLSEKQGVLDVIAKDFHPIYAGILRKALKNPENALRIQSAAIITKIGMDFEEKRNLFMKKYLETPDNTVLHRQGSLRHIWALCMRRAYTAPYREATPCPYHPWATKSGSPTIFRIPL